MNPFCEIAVEEALRIKERKEAKEVVAVSIGPMECKDTIRTALGMGADRGIHVHGDVDMPPLMVANILAKIAERENPGIFLLGKQAIDDDSNQTGQMLAGLLGWPQATFASKVVIEPNSGKVLVTREVDGGLQTLKLAIPSVITTDLRLNQPRFATLPNIMKAKKKPIDTLEVSDLDIKRVPLMSIGNVEEPPKREGAAILDSVSELIERLQKEAKVL